MTTTPENARAGRAPLPTPAPPASAIPRSAAGQPLPGPAPTYPGRGTPSSPQPSERQAAGKPAPETGAAVPGYSPAAPVRGPGQDPAGGALDGARGTPAGSTLSAGQAAIAAAMSEDRGPDSLDAHVRRLMADLGLRGYHTHDSRRSRAGFPDWTITGRRTIFRELKTQRGKVSQAQQEWLDALTEAGDDADVWRPADLLTGRIARELAAISKLAGAVAWTA